MFISLSSHTRKTNFSNPSSCFPFPFPHLSRPNLPLTGGQGDTLLPIYETKGRQIDKHPRLPKLPSKVSQVACLLASYYDCLAVPTEDEQVGAHFRKLLCETPSKCPHFHCPRPCLDTGARKDFFHGRLSWRKGKKPTRRPSAISDRRRRWSANNGSSRSAFTAKRYSVPSVAYVESCRHARRGANGAGGWDFPGRAVTKIILREFVCVARESPSQAQLLASRSRRKTTRRRSERLQTAECWLSESIRT